MTRRRAIVKVRRVAGTTVVTIPLFILSQITIKEGDLVVIEAAGQNGIKITREED